MPGAQFISPPTMMKKSWTSEEKEKEEEEEEEDNFRDPTSSPPVPLVGGKKLKEALRLLARGSVWRGGGGLSGFEGNFSASFCSLTLSRP